MEPNKFPIKPYLNEIKYQIQSALNALSESNDAYNAHHHFLIHCTIIFKIIKPFIDREKINKQETGWKNELKKEKREEALHMYFRNSKEYVDIPKFKNIRDCFEHYDERLDIAIQNGIIIEDNFVRKGKVEDYLPIAGKFKLRNFENGKITIAGFVIDTIVIKKWLVDLSDYIDKNPVDENNIGSITHNVFI